MRRLLTLVFLCMGVLWAREVAYDDVYIPQEYHNTLVRLCILYRVPVSLVARVIECESGWNPRATGHNRNGSRDMGLMQLNSAYLADFAWRYNDDDTIDPYNPSTSMRVGIRYLAHLHALTGSWMGAVASYNCGLARYRRWQRGEQDLPQSTKQYLEYVFM